MPQVITQKKAVQQAHVGNGRAGFAGRGLAFVVAFPWVTRGEGDAVVRFLATQGKAHQNHQQQGLVGVAGWAAHLAVVQHGGVAGRYFRLHGTVTLLLRPCNCWHLQKRLLAIQKKPLVPLLQIGQAALCQSRRAQGLPLRFILWRAGRLGNGQQQLHQGDFLYRVAAQRAVGGFAENLPQTHPPDIHDGQPGFINQVESSLHRVCTPSLLQVSFLIRRYPRSVRYSRRWRSCTVTPCRPCSWPASSTRHKRRTLTSSGQVSSPK